MPDPIPMERPGQLSILERAALEELDHTSAELSRLERLLIAALAEIGRLQRTPPSPPNGSADLDGLTPRERDVFALIVEGHTNKAAASILGISDRTVEIHRLRIQRKLGVRGSAGLARYATEAA